MFRSTRERKKQIPKIQIPKIRAKTTRELKELENPELIRTADAKEATKNTDKSDNSTKSYFRSYKDAAKQQWINEVKIAEEWKEGIEPTFTGKTKSAKQVPKELGKFFKMLFAHKKINKQDAEDIFKNSTKNNSLPHQ